MALLLLVGLLVQAAPAQDTAPFPRAGGYVGSAECGRCHERQRDKLLGAAHAAVLQAAALPGCETCHGPGQEHSAGDNDPAAITLPRLLSPTAQAAFCGRCHQDQIARHGGDMPGLQLAGRECTECHEIHGRSDPGPLPGVRFASRADAAHAEAAGSAACVACHPLRDELLGRSAHRELAATARDDGCELCHGRGQLHADARGAARLITRPDRAADGVATCRGCHDDVDAERFHWRGRQAPFLAAGVVCATCHRVHQPIEGSVPVVAAAPATLTNRACAECHLPALCTMPGSPHHQLGGPDVSLLQGCGSCHPGGAAHAAAGGRRDLVQRLGGAAASVQAQLCLSCHRDDEALRGSDHGAHTRAGVGCADCHGPLHGAAGSGSAMQALDRAADRCGQCHAAQAAEFRLPNHHPVPEGRMRCTACHDVHRARRRVRDPELLEGSCARCHPRYAGPFVFAHQAGRRDGCVVCHLPHGSPNRRLLRQPNSQQNCLQCHGDFPAFHDQTPGAVFTDCLRCHTEVHGSNHSRFLFR